MACLIVAFVCWLAGFIRRRTLLRHSSAYRRQKVLRGEPLESLDELPPPAGMQMSTPEYAFKYAYGRGARYGRQKVRGGPTEHMHVHMEQEHIEQAGMEQHELPAAATGTGDGVSGAAARARAARVLAAWAGGVTVKAAARASEGEGGEGGG